MKSTSSPKNGFSRVLGVVRLAELARGDDEPGGAQAQAAPLEARHDLAGEAALDGVGLREDQGALDGHAAAQLAAASLAGARAFACARTFGAQRPPGASTGDRRRAVRADLPGGLERPVALAHGARSFVVQTGQTRKSGSTAQPQTLHFSSGAPRRLSIARISSSRSRTSSRYSGGRKSM